MFTFKINKSVYMHSQAYNFKTHTEKVGPISQCLASLKHHHQIYPATHTHPHADTRGTLTAVPQPLQVKHVFLSHLPASNRWEGR